MYDFDWLVIGSGFGGSVSAHRLTEKGYTVGVLEMGKRWASADFPKTNWDLKRFLWAPLAGCHGIFKMTLLPHVFILSGAGVGGGSLVYANTLLVPPPRAFEDPKWRDLADWKAVLPPFYALAKRMLGAVETNKFFAADELVRAHAKRIGREASFAPTTVAVYFGEAGTSTPDPFFEGEGPARQGCNYCGGCMVGCRFGAKNTLDKNYLYLAEKRGAVVFPERRVTLVEPLPDGGYRVHTERSTSLFRKDRKVYTARGVVFSAGVLGTVDLLLKCKEQGALAKLSDRLGDFVRTNSEAVLGVTARDPAKKMNQGVAIGSQIELDDHTHLEPVRYSSGSDSLALITTPLTDGGGRVPRWLRWMGVVLTSPLDVLRGWMPFGWAERTVILLVMQTLDNHMRIRRGRRWFWPFDKQLVTQIPPGQPPVPTYIASANVAARAIAKDLGGMARSSVTEAVLDVPTTAHILGGCAMGTSAADGVIDAKCRVFGYDHMMVIDGSMIGANLGVNPSLTITALAEHAMSHVPRKGEPGSVG
jgi:cholesterol oxidase